MNPHTTTPSGTDPGSGILPSPRLLLLGFSPAELAALRTACTSGAPSFQPFSRVVGVEEFSRIQSDGYDVVAVNLAGAGVDDIAYLMRLSAQCATVVVTGQDQRHAGWLRLVDEILAPQDFVPSALVASAARALECREIREQGVTAGTVLESLRRDLGDANHGGPGLVILDDSDRVLYANAAGRELEAGLAEGVLKDLRQSCEPSGRAMLSPTPWMPEPMAISSLSLDIRGRPFNLLRFERADGHETRRQLSRELERLDPDTGVLRAAPFHRRLVQALAGRAERNSMLGVIVVRLGEEDSLPEPGTMRLSADALRARLRADDLLGRLDDRTFAVLLAHVSQMTDLAHIARKLVASLDGVSTGVLRTGMAGAPEDADEADELIRRALEAVDAEPAARGPSFAPTEAGRRAQRRFEIERRLPRALEQGTFELYVQPFIAPGDWRVVGGEALLRWTDEALGNVPPNLLVDVAEHLGLMAPLGDYVIDRALPLLARGCRERPDFHLSVNISAGQLLGPDFVPRLAVRMAQAGVPVDALELEITEGLVVEDAARTRQVLGELGELGVRVMLDDFGTGFSSLGYLMELPVNGIKIDRLFCEGLPHRSNHVAMMRTLLMLARHLKLDVVAEGVETREQAQWLARYGVPRLQGFLYSPAVPPEAFQHLLTDLPDWNAGMSEG